MRDAGRRWTCAVIGLAIFGCEGSHKALPSARNSHEAATASGASDAAADDPATASAGGPVAEEGADEGAGLPEPPEVEAGSPWPTPPEGYGLPVFAVPPPSEEDLQLHALAGYEVVAVYQKPDIEATKVGFLRYGQRKRVTKKLGSEGCAKGWYQLEGGGFACASKGLVVEASAPFMKYEPPPPRLDQPFPYDWAYVRKWNTPMWWRVPTAEELVIAKEKRAELEALRNGEPPPGEDQPAPPKPKPDTDGDGAALPTLDDGPDAPPKPAGGDAGGEAEEVSPAPEPEPVGDEGADVSPDAPPEEEPVKLPLNPQHPWLEKGYFISLAGTERDAGRSYWRTARGAFVPQSETFKYEAKDFQGVELTEEVSLPVGWVDVKEAKVYELGDDDKLKVVDKAERRTFFDFEEEVEHGGKTYMRTKEGRLVRKDQVEQPALQALPKGLQPWDRWIDVSLSKQLLVAYEGTRPVYVTRVSTGKKGTDEEPFETPTGRWRIYSKQVTSNMDGATATDGNYAIQDVPWVMYFEGSYALHGAFWHRSFGRVRSHGCVNLGPSDARWLFNWTTPFLPAGWHGVHSTDESPGTTVVVHE